MAVPVSASCFPLSNLQQATQAPPPPSPQQLSPPSPIAAGIATRPTAYTPRTPSPPPLHGGSYGSPCPTPLESPPRRSAATEGRRNGFALLCRLARAVALAAGLFTVAWGVYAWRTAGGDADMANVLAIWADEDHLRDLCWDHLDDTVDRTFTDKVKQCLHDKHATPHTSPEKRFLVWYGSPGRRPPVEHLNGSFIPLDESLIRFDESFVRSDESNQTHSYLAFNTLFKYEDTA